MSLRDQILAIEDRKVSAVEVPEWGLTVFVKSMSVGQRDRFELAYSNDPSDKICARVVCWTACDEAGNRLFTDADVDALNEKSPAAIRRIFNVAVDISAVSEDAVNAASKA